MEKTKEIIYFKKVDQFVDNLIKETGKLYSVIDYTQYVPLTPDILFTKRFEVIYLDSNYVDKLYHNEGIFKNPAGIYLYLSKTDFETTYKIKIIYDINSLDEVKLFVNNLSKLK